MDLFATLLRPKRRILTTRRAHVGTDGRTGNGTITITANSRPDGSCVLLLTPRGSVNLEGSRLSDTAYQSISPGSEPLAVRAGRRR
eukprot:4975889-Pyramimonas_sp.AAC.1